MRTVLRLVLVGLLALSCGQRTTRTNVVLIGIDTLRPDHLGCYGYERPTSPHIDGLAANAVLFEMPVSQCPWTLPSFASILTSLYPSQHGAGINMSELGKAFPTMAGILAAEGYATGAVLSSRVLSPEFGVGRGFQYYDVNAAGEERDALEVTDLGLGWLDGLEGCPFFLFLHYFDPHLPYSPPAPYDTVFDGGAGSSIGAVFDIKPLIEHDSNLRDKLSEMSGRDWERIVSLYDGEIAFTDMAIGRLLEGLNDRGLGSNTLVVLLADHGEEFYEHGGLGHGHTLFNEVIRVPLIFSSADRLPAGVRVKGQVRMVDVLPTVLDLLDIETDFTYEGVSLLGMVSDKTRARTREGSLFPAHMAYSEGLRRGTERKSISAHPWKLIHDTETGSDVVFNLEQDPAEFEPVEAGTLESISLLRNALVSTLIGMEDTWYVDMVPGPAPCEFGVRVSVQQDLSRGTVTFCRYVGQDGSILEPSGVRIEGPRLNIEGLLLREPLTLAFQVEAPPGLPVEFDLRIDGKPAEEETYVGSKLLRPGGMPFSLHARRKALRTGGRPSGDRPPPYFIIRLSERRRPGRTTASLSSDTAEELRALGYIQ